MGKRGDDAGHGYNDLLQMAFLAEVFWKQGVERFIRKQIIGCWPW